MRHPDNCTLGVFKECVKGCFLFTTLTFELTKA